MRITREFQTGDIGIIFRESVEGKLQFPTGPQTATAEKGDPGKIIGRAHLGSDMEWVVLFDQNGLIYRAEVTEAQIERTE